MNATTQSLVDRLPQKPMLIPAEIAAVFGMADGGPIIAAIKRGKIAASIVERKFYISREAAVKYIESTEFKPDEA